MRWFMSFVWLRCLDVFGWLWEWALLMQGMIELLLQTLATQKKCDCMSTSAPRRQLWSYDSILVGSWGCSQGDCSAAEGE